MRNGGLLACQPRFYRSRATLFPTETRLSHAPLRLPFSGGTSHYSPALSLTVPDIIQERNTLLPGSSALGTQFGDPPSASGAHPGLNTDPGAPAAPPAVTPGWRPRAPWRHAAPKHTHADARACSPTPRAHRRSGHLHIWRRKSLPGDLLGSSHHRDHPVRRRRPDSPALAGAASVRSGSGAKQQRSGSAHGKRTSTRAHRRGHRSPRPAPSSLAPGRRCSGGPRQLGPRAGGRGAPRPSGSRHRSPARCRQRLT